MATTITAAPIADYPTLIAAIVAWIDRTDFDQVAPQLVGLAHARLNRALRVRDMLTRSTTPVVAGTQYVDLPDDFIELKRVVPITSPPSNPLSPMTIDQVSERQAENATSVVPTSYALHSTELELAPIPAGDFTLEISYYGQIPRLSDVAPTNWVVVKWPEAYLWGALVEAAPFLRDDDRVQIWKDKFELSINEIQAADDRAQLAGGKLVSRRGPLI